MNRLRYWLSLGFLLLCFEGIYAQNEAPVADLAMAQAWMKQASRHFQVQPDSALHYLELALPVFEREKEWQLYSNTLNGIVGSLLGNGEFQLAENKAREAVQKSEQLGAEVDSRIYLDALNNLSTIYRRKGDFHQAQKYYGEALKILRRTENKDFQLISRTYYNLGILLRLQGNPEGAIRHYEKALDAFRSIQPAAHPNDIRLNFALARAYEDLGQWDQERAYLLRCQSLIRQFSAKKYQNYLIDAYHRMAQMQLEMAQYDSAAYFVQLARQSTAEELLYRKQVGEEILADIAWEKGQEALAFGHYRQALDFSLNEWKGLGKSPPIAHAYQRLAERKAEQADWDSASQFYFLALEHLTKTSKPLSGQTLPQAKEIIHPFEAISVLKGIAFCAQQKYLRKGQNSLAELIFSTCELADQSIKLLRRTHQEDQAKLRVGTESRKIYEIALEIAYLQYLATQEHSYVSLAFWFAEQSKAMVLFDALQNNTASMQVGLPDSALEREQTLKLESSFYRNQLFEAQEKKDSLKAAKFSLRLFEAEERYQQFIASLEDDYPAYYQMKYNDHFVEIEQVQQAIKPAERVLSCFWGESAVYLFSISPTQVQFEKIVALDSLRSQVMELLALLKQPTYSAPGYERFAHLSGQLGTQLLPDWDPEHPYRRLTVIGDGPLSYLPFSVLTFGPLPFGSPQNISQAYRKFPYLLRQTAVHYAYSATLLYQPGGSPDRAEQFLAAFAPLYQGSLALSYNQGQAQGIADLMQGKAILADAATEIAFRAEAPYYQVIHLAMHGFSDAQNPQKAHLLFSSSVDSGDARLHTHELYDMHLQAELVVLSACETATGQIVQGEGVMSLARAFRYAGCPSMISSVWNADGRSSHDLMLGLYPLLQAGQPKVVALQQTQLQFLGQCMPDLTHPYYWANYVLIGNGEVIRKGTPWTIIAAGLVAVLILGAVFVFFSEKNRKN